MEKDPRTWLWTCRAGFEPDLALEIGRGSGPAGPALVTSTGRPTDWPVFARMGFPVAADIAATGEAVAPAIAAALDAECAGRPRPWVLQAWVPDADETNPLSDFTAKLGEKVRAVRPDLDEHRMGEAAGVVRYGGVLAQVCVVSRDRAFVGAIAAQDCPTRAEGGRARSWMPRNSPSRAARKLVEALDWFGFGPGPGERCVDLGAAPGGWTAVLLERKTQVIAVDPAKLAPDIRSAKGVTHVQASAFQYLPQHPVDWLFCDMAWRPLEVAELLAKWGRRRLANGLVANVKLPMKERVKFVRRILEIVAAGGWNDLRARHLYHDRDEFTLAAWRS